MNMHQRNNSDKVTLAGAVIAVICIVIYIGSLIQATVRLYLSADQRKIAAKLEFANIADIASSAGALGFMEEPFVEAMNHALATSRCLEALIISGPDGEYAFERQKDRAVTWVNNSPRFKNRFDFSSESLYRPLQIQGLRNVNIQAVAGAFDYAVLSKILKETLFFILIGFILAFFTMLFQMLLTKPAMQTVPAPQFKDNVSQPKVPKKPEMPVAVKAPEPREEPKTYQVPEKSGELPDFSGLPDFNDLSKGRTKVETSEEQEKFEVPDELMNYEMPDEAENEATDEAEKPLETEIPDELMNFKMPDEPDEVTDESSDEAEKPVEIEIPEEAPVEAPSNKAPEESPKGLYSPRSGIGWEEYTVERLDSELHRCASEEKDLSLIIMDFTDTLDDDTFNHAAQEAIVFFASRDLLFEYGKQGITVIIPGIDLDAGIVKSQKFQQRIIEKYPYCGLHIGLSSRSDRLLNAGRILLEAMEALDRAKSDPDTAIIGFRSDPDKYRAFIASQNQRRS